MKVKIVGAAAVLAGLSVAAVAVANAGSDQATDRLISHSTGYRVITPAEASQPIPVPANAWSVFTDSEGTPPVAAQALVAPAPATTVPVTTGFRVITPLEATQQIPVPSNATSVYRDQEGVPPVPSRTASDSSSAAASPDDYCQGQPGGPSAATDRASDTSGNASPMCGQASGACYEATRDHDIDFVEGTGDGTVYLTTRWCGESGTLTYRSSTSYTVIKGVCSVHQPVSHWKVGGGVGTSSVDIRVQADFACNYGEGPTLYQTVWYVLRYYAWDGNPAYADHH